MLIGLVTKNGIFNRRVCQSTTRTGKTKLEAILEASEARLRPILMTSLLFHWVLYLSLCRLERLPPVE
jgi:HAE1 family hydrophobic/amphiphilic exporter-1/multidrug efflux pump